MTKKKEKNMKGKNGKNNAEANGKNNAEVNGKANGKQNANGNGNGDDFGQLRKIAKRLEIPAAKKKRDDLLESILDAIEEKVGSGGQEWYDANTDLVEFYNEHVPEDDSGEGAAGAEPVKVDGKEDGEKIEAKPGKAGSTKDRAAAAKEKAKETKKNKPQKKTAPRNAGVGEYARSILAESWDAPNKDVASRVREKFGSATTPACISWYRRDMKKKGLRK